MSSPLESLPAPPPRTSNDDDLDDDKVVIYIWRSRGWRKYRVAA